MVGMPDEVPDIYCDSVLANVTPFDMVLQLSRRPADAVNSANAPAELVGCIRMSLEQAKALAIVLTKPSYHGKSLG